MNEIINRIWSNKWVFLGTFFLVFTLSYLVLVAIDFLPEAPTEETEIIGEMPEEVVTAETVSAQIDKHSKPETPAVDDITYHDIMPNAILIKKLNKEIKVLNPTSRNIADLDSALLDGVVRHPDSATLSQAGNVFILGHSSYLPNVFNKNFQAFNGIQNLEWGDIIEVTSDDLIFEYRVEKVYQARAEDVTVPIAGTEKLLTLATCNSFGSVDDRYIVEAKQIGFRHL